MRFGHCTEEGYCNNPRLINGGQHLRSRDKRWFYHWIQMGLMQLLVEMELPLPLLRPKNHLKWNVLSLGKIFVTDVYNEFPIYYTSFSKMYYCIVLYNVSKCMIYYTFKNLILIYINKSMSFATTLIFNFNNPHHARMVLVNNPQPSSHLITFRLSFLFVILCTSKTFMCTQSTS